MTIDEQKEAMRAAMRDSIFQQVQMLLKFEGAAALALQVPDTDILILVGPQERIQGYLATPIPYGAAGAGLRDTTLGQAIDAVLKLAHNIRGLPERTGEQEAYNEALEHSIAAIHALKGTK